ncbi:MAG: zincin-like metallopeptidase domain-containing protein [Aurantimonas endophytica]|uniref:ArdC family protein n=1 Tax=Aurantimonas endophytica TaxID=1522175 RepID=UPI003002983A
MPKTFDVHQEITDRIVSAIESAPEFQLPWVRSGAGSLKRPVNIASANPYNGVNVLSLWITAQAAGFASNLWGTYRQWQERGGQVRKGEKASLVVFYKRITVDEENEQASELTPGERLIARASWVFNASQVEGYEVSVDLVPSEATFDPVARAEGFATATGAQICEHGDRACYIPATDTIQMPERQRFRGTPTTTPAEGFYSTLCHELVHWSGTKHRLARDLTGRFGSEAYAIEELVAELGAAFLCSDLVITPEPRADHAAYIRCWLQVLKSDKRAVFTAASKASEAAKWLLAHDSRAADASA